MPKVNTNSNINYFQSAGRIIQHDLWLDQSLTKDSSPTFANLAISGDTEIKGNLYVYGNTSIFNTNITEFEDNILLINRNESGPGVTLGLAGLEISRGIGTEGFRAVFRESDDTFRIGFVNSTQAVATREDIPLNKGIAIWNDLNNRFDSKSSIELSIDLLSSENSISNSSGSLRVSGGIGVSKDIYIVGKTNYNNGGNINWDSDLQINSTSRIALLPETSVFIPQNKSLIFGTNGNSILSNGLDNLTINANEKIRIPSDIPIIFSKTDNLKSIRGDSSGSLSLTSGLDISFTPTRNVVIPTTIPITFGSSNQKIFGTTSGDLSITGNNIFLNPLTGLNAILPQESGIKFGPVARVWSSPTNSLLFSATGVIVTSGTFKLENGTSLFIGQTEIRYSTTGSLIQVLGTMDIPNIIVSSISSGSLSVNGNAYIRGNTVIDGNLNVNGTTTTINTDVQLIKDNLIVVNNAPAGLADSGILMKRSSTTGNVYAGLIYQELNDQIVLGYTNTDPGAGQVTFNKYAPLLSDRITIVNTGNSNINSAGSSLITYGGAFINKSVRIGEDIYLLNPSSTIFLGGTTFKTIDSGTNINISAARTFISSTVDSNANSTIGSLIVGGGSYISKNLIVKGGINASNTSTGHQLGNLIFNNSNIISTNGTLVSFSNGFGIKDYLFNQLTSGQLSISSMNIGNTSGIVISTHQLDILGQTTITDTLELIESSLLLNSGSTVFSLIPTGSNLSITSDSISSSNFTLKNLSFFLQNSSGSSVFSYNQTSGVLNISSGVYTKITDQTDLVGKLIIKLNNTTSASSNWFLLGGLESFPNFSMVVDDQFSFINDALVFSHFYSGEIIPIKVYQNGGVISYFINVDANKSRSVTVFNKSGEIIKVSISTASLPLSSTLIYDTTSNSPNNNSFLGNIYSFGEINFSDPKPRFGYLNNDTSGSTKVGVAFERSKNLIVDSQSPVYTLTLPSQTGVISTNQIKFGVTGPTDDLTGAILKTPDSNIYRIKVYDPNIKVATIEGNFITPPILNNIVNIYDRGFIDFVYDPATNLTELKYSPSSNVDPYSNLKIGELNVTRNIDINGELAIKSNKSASSVSSASCVLSGGMGISKNLFVKESITVTGTAGGGITTLSNNLLNYSDSLRIGSALYLNTTGNIGIKTTTVNTDLTFRSNGSIGIDNQDGHLNILNRLKLYGTASKVEVSAGSLITNEGCIVSILNTTDSSSNSVGALVVAGGLSISGNANATNSTMGGGLTVAGGGAISKDLYVGGNLFINGAIELTGAVITPSITIDSGTLVNCNLATIVYTKLVKLSNNYTLQLCLEINPNEAYRNTEVQFTLPGRLGSLTKRTDTVTSSSGWVDNVTVNPLFNVLSCGVAGTQRALVKFQSISTDTHYLQIMCMYNDL